MFAVLKLEQIGDNFFAYRRYHKRKIASYEHRLWQMTKPSLKPWVDRLTDIRDDVFVRARLRGTPDYSRATRSGARGFYIRYFLVPGIYEINDRVAWQRACRYFAQSIDGQLAVINREDAVEWLQNECSESLS